MHPHPLKALGLTLALLCAGCGGGSEEASLELNVGEAGVLLGLDAATSASSAELELQWQLGVTNLGTEPCPLAVYRWLGPWSEASTEALPTRGASQQSSWPELFDEGERVDSAVVEVGERVELGPQLLAPPADRVIGSLGLATCPGAQLRVDVEAEASADLGVRGLAEALNLTLLRLR